ncbi:hypothetical protein [Clostridium sp. ZBS20]|uniref:hypothetical protein n=1 Tax=Clostridium sp. ZBS20 TaxID=2949966 RepID=UPI00207AED38|nr:hypothetical protein [Clostridium sp. ZBS20]
MTAEWTKESRYEVIQAFQNVGEHLDNRYTIKTYMTKDTIELYVVGLRSAENERLPSAYQLMPNGFLSIVCMLMIQLDG